MKHKSLESITRSNAKLKPALLWYLFSSRNKSNAKPLCLMCNSISLPLNGDGSSSESFGLIHLGSHFLVAHVISPLSFIESQHLGNPSHTSFSLE